MKEYRLQRAYLEITNLCNLRCSFCPGTRRELGAVTPEGFETLAKRLRPYTGCLHLHLMGEPLTHPQLGELLEIGTRLGFRLQITTNGLLLPRKGAVLLESPGVEKVSISLHSFEANEGGELERYLSQCLDFARAAAQRGKKVALRLWNLDGAETSGENARNGEILARLHRDFPGAWKVGYQGTTLSPNIYLEWGERFDWPDLTLPTERRQKKLFCRGLRDQIGVLWDGTVVPCCLDGQGDVPLGNLYRQELEEILSGPRAKAIYEGFSRRQAVEALCQTCGYARRF